MVDAGVAQLARDPPARREHEVHRRVDVSQIASGRLAGPLAADHGSHGLQIGMARGYDRDAKALAGIERRPRESIRVTHLDDGRPELFQPFGACASLPAEAIAAT